MAARGPPQYPQENQCQTPQPHVKGLDKGEDQHPGVEAINCQRFEPVMHVPAIQCLRMVAVVPDDFGECCDNVLVDGDGSSIGQLNDIHEDTQGMRFHQRANEDQTQCRVYETCVHLLLLLIGKLWNNLNIQIVLQGATVSEDIQAVLGKFAVALTTHAGFVDDLDALGDHYVSARQHGGKLF